VSSGFSFIYSFFYCIHFSVLRCLTLVTQVFYTWSMSPAHSALVILEIGSHFFSRPVWTMILCFKLPTIAGLSGVLDHSFFFSAEKRVLWAFFPDWAQTLILLISAFPVARITGVSHAGPAHCLIWEMSVQVLSTVLLICDVWVLYEFWGLILL
jgi:hypothetical protein